MNPLEPTSTVVCGLIAVLCAAVHYLSIPYLLHSSCILSTSLQWDGKLNHVDQGGIPANNFWAFVGDSNGLGKGVSVLERVHSNSAYILIDYFAYFYFFLHWLVFLLNIDGPWNASRIL